MWTLAASLSAQFQHIRDSLYRDARRMLEALDLKDNELDSIDVEQVQAWILLAIYEFMRTNYRRGWKSAGRAFRLVQLMRLYAVDVPHSPTIRQRNGSAQADWIETEEKRRTFWMAYILDRFISIRNEWPLTINEQVVRLPLSPISSSSSLGYSVKLIPAHLDFHSTPCPRKGISKRQTASYGLSIRSHCCS
jgi:Fungal specific transcription factor domain